MRFRLPLLALALSLALGACAKQEALFVVLPNPDGSSGAVTIDDGNKKVLLDRPYAAGAVRGGDAERVEVAPEKVDQVFGKAIAAQPILPAHFRLYFIMDSDKLTPESERAYQSVFADIKRRAAYQVEVIGHTDTMGEKSYNHTLSLSRAKAVADRLGRDGLDRSAIKVSGRGELDLAVPTHDEVPQPRNRRVEIDVR